MKTRGILKGLVLGLVKVFVHPVLQIFFDSKYLKGKFFDNSFQGYIWGLKSIWFNNVLRLSKPLKWPSSFRVSISDDKRLMFDPSDLNNFFSFGIYFQNFSADISIGKGTYIAPNVGIITSNHNPKNLDEHLEGRPVIIGENCWLGMNSIILPGVTLGANTIVGAGSVVTKSFPKGNSVIAGNPARIIKTLN